MKRRLRLRLLSALAAITLLAGTAQTAAPLTGAAADNLVSNSTFETGTTKWAIYKESGGAAKLSVDDGRLACTITNVGTKNYAVQIYYDGNVKLMQNGVYHVHYEISSSVPRYVESMIQENGGTYQSYTWKGFNIDTEPTVIDYTFTMEEESDIMTKFCFNVGLQEKDGELGEHVIYLDNVVIELEDDSAVDFESVGPYQAPILTDQIGFRPNDKKTAVIRKDGGDTFKVINADTKEAVYTGTLGDAVKNSSANENDRIADFSSVKEPGTYYISCGDLDDSYPFVIAENPYGELLDASVRMLYLQRCGVEVEDADFGHKACHAELATIYKTSEKIDVSGGWHDAGDYGRYVVPGAKAVADLMYGYLANPTLFSDSIGIPESGNGTPDVLDEARFELEWMLKMQAASGGVYHKVSCATFPGYVAPTAEKGELIVTPISSTATADFCASMALAAEVYEQFDADFAGKCKAAAKKSWDYLQENPDFNFTNPSDISTGDYGDRSDKDERYWAACQMYRLTGDASFLENAGDASDKDTERLGWANMRDYGNIALLTMKNADAAFVENAKTAMSTTAGTYANIVTSSPYGSPVTKYNWGSNMNIADAGIVLMLNGKYDEANEPLHYLLGKNPLGTCFVTGFGTVSPENPHHRPSMAAGKAQPGMLVGGVDSALEDKAAEAFCADNPPAKRYVDNSESYSTNEITIYWNSPLTYLLALTEAGEAAPIDEPVETTTELVVTTAPTDETTAPAAETTTVPAVETTTPVETTSPSDETTVPQGAEQGMLGDVTLDGVVDVSDAVLFARYLNEDATAKITAQGIANGDVTRDKINDSADVILILRYIAHLVTSF